MAAAVRRVIHQATRHVTPAFTLNQVGGYALEKARLTEEGSLLEITTALLMCPLTLEAVLNQVGHKLFVEDDQDPKRWAEVERSSPRDKVKAIAKRLGIKVDLGRKPFNLFTQMFEFRSELAHAKSMKLTVTDVPAGSLDDDPGLADIPGLQACWEVRCNLDTAIRWREATAQMSQFLCGVADVGNPLVGGYTTTWSADFMDD